MAQNAQLKALHELGQSIWYDNLSRDVLRSGKLAEYIEAGVNGLTSNPSIFKKAIADTADYDEKLSQLKDLHHDTEMLCEALMLSDVGKAADLLRPIYDESKGQDGYASIEVSPLLANNTEQTVQAATRLWKTLDRPNIMVKIPATPEGLPAIREVISEGINVNVTLIFSEQVYRTVADAFLSGLEDRLREGKALAGIASVASFFVSRVDAITEKDLAQKISGGALPAEKEKEYLGKVGVANSKCAYVAFEEIFQSERFLKLKAEGAEIQRPLWASTGVKNPELPPLLYVEELAGKHTVNTLPPAALDKLLAGGNISAKLHQGTNEAKELLANLRRDGVAFDELLVKLQVDGVEAFATSYEDLLGALEQKLKDVR